jgi:tRNA pseudouridine38-40 synthase
MCAALPCLIGEHDFSSFRAAECQAKSPVKTLNDCRIFRVEKMLVFEFRANAFLHHMVRNLVGALVYVGNGRLTIAGLLELLQARDRRLAPPTFSPSGLYFSGVEYDRCWGLPQEGRIIASPVFSS